MQLAQFLFAAMVVMMKRETTRAQQSSGKLGGMDVLAIVMECKWNNIANLPWKLKVFDCLNKIFDFGPADHQSRFSLACGILFSHFSKSGIPVEWDQNRHPVDTDNATCADTESDPSLQLTLINSMYKLSTRRRKSASIVTFVMSDKNLDDTILEWPATYLTIKDNVLFIVINMDESPSVNDVKNLAGGRNESRVIHIPNPNKGYLCTESDMNKVKRGLCAPLYHEILNVTACTLVNAADRMCERLVTYKPQLQRAEVICPGLLSTNTEPCECPNTTTTSTTATSTNAISTSASARTTAAGTGIISIIVYCAAGLFVLLAVVIGIYFVCRKKKQPSSAKSTPSTSLSKFSFTALFGLWKPQMSARSSIDSQQTKKITSKLVVSPKTGKKAPPVSPSSSRSKVNPKKSATSVVMMKSNMKASHSKSIEISASKMGQSKTILSSISPSKTSKITSSNTGQSKRSESPTKSKT